jgi:hypothetical protein
LKSAKIISIQGIINVGISIALFFAKIGKMRCVVLMDTLYGKFWFWFFTIDMTFFVWQHQCFCIRHILQMGILLHYQWLVMNMNFVCFERYYVIYLIRILLGGIEVRNGSNN